MTSHIVPDKQFAKGMWTHFLDFCINIIAGLHFHMYYVFATLLESQGTKSNNNGHEVRKHNYMLNIWIRTNWLLKFYFSIFMSWEVSLLLLLKRKIISVGAKTYWPSKDRKAELSQGQQVILILQMLVLFL